MKYQPCILCQGNRFIKIATRYSGDSLMQIACCSRCSLVQVNPRKDKEFYGKYYKEQYWRPREITKEIFFRNSAIRASQRVNFLNSSIGLSNKTILDIGCSYGEFLKQVLPYVKKAVGIEPDGGFAEYGRDNFGLDIFTGNLEAYLQDRKDGLFDIVTLFTVIEHIHSPLDFLTQLKMILKSDGLLILEFPEMFGLLKAINNRLVLQEIFSPHHLQYFSKNTISLTLKKTGFSIVEARRIRKKYMCLAARQTNPDFKIIHNKFKRNSEEVKILLLVLIWKIKSFFVKLYKRINV